MAMSILRKVLACAALLFAIPTLALAAACPVNTGTLDIVPKGPCTGILASVDTSRTWPQGTRYLTQEDIITTSTGATTPIRVVGGTVAVSLDGVATSVTGVVQRSVDGGTTWHLATTSSISGDPATFIAPILNTESGVAWYRVKLSALTGASVNIAISAQAYQ